MPIFKGLIPNSILCLIPKVLLQCHIFRHSMPNSKGLPTPILPDISKALLQPPRVKRGKCQASTFFPWDKIRQLGTTKILYFYFSHPPVTITIFHKHHQIKGIILLVADKLNFLLWYCSTKLIVWILSCLFPLSPLSMSISYR